MERGNRGKASVLERTGWRHFEKKETPSYVSVNRPGWYNVPLSGGGDVDLVDIEQAYGES
jgi:hypothetical protein